MIQLLVIAACLGVHFAGDVPALWAVSGWVAALVLLAPMLPPLMAWPAVVRCGREVDRHGSHLAVRLAERITLAARVLVVLVQLFSVLALGELAAIRGWIGDTVLIDELVVLVPVVLGLALCWWVVYPIERRLREAVVLTQLDRGGPIYPILPRGVFVSLAIRHQLSLFILPIIAVMGWAEAVAFAALWAQTRGLAGWSDQTWAYAGAGVQVLGVVVVMGAAPIIVRTMWDTLSLGSSELRRRLDQLCDRHRARVRDVLVWRTHGSIANAAVVGLARRLRFILLTDALIDHLSLVELEAVAAHEVGHVRLHHMAWLTGTLIAGLGAMLTLLDYGVVAIGTERAERLAWLYWLAVGLGVGGMALLFGVVSRRFEWQADAFAARDLSGADPDPEVPRTISATAAGAMGSALRRVAILNAMDARAFTFRHGSIQHRCQRLDGLVGLDADRLPIDRTVRRIKAFVLAGLLVTAAGIALELATPTS